MKVIAWRQNKKGEIEDLLDKKLWMNWLFIYSGECFAAVAIDPSGTWGFGKVVRDLLTGPGSILVKVVGWAFIYYFLKWLNTMLDMGILNSLLRVIVLFCAVYMVLVDLGGKINRITSGQF